LRFYRRGVRRQNRTVSPLRAAPHYGTALNATEGRARAKARGVKLGRKPKLTPHQQQEARRRKADGEPHRDIALSYDSPQQHDFAIVSARYCAAMSCKVYG